MMKRILLDVDECCLAWIDGFREFAQEQLGREIVGFPDNFELHNWLELPKDEAVKLIFHYNENDERFGKLKPMHKADIYLPKLKNKGFDLIAISACSQKEFTQQKRKENLTNAFGDIFSDIHCVEGSENKKHYLEKYPKCYWVEDRAGNAKLGMAAGHKEFVIRYVHNRKEEENHPELNWVDDWEEIYCKVMTEPFRKIA